MADAHRDNGKRFIVTADRKRTAFLELERITRIALLARIVGDDVGSHDAIPDIVGFGQCVRVGRNVGPEILVRLPLITSS